MPFRTFGLCLAFGLGLATLDQPAQAEPVAFRLAFGGRDIGALSFDATSSGSDLSLQIRLADTPLSVADGTFAATSQGARTEAGTPALQYRSASDFTRGSRRVSIVQAGGQVIQASVSPDEDQTTLSDPAQVPAGTLDPVQVFARLAAGSGSGACPAPLSLYDGRRVATIALAEVERDADHVACEGRYEVVAGPAHLHPLGIGTFRMSLVYDLSSAGQRLAEMDLSTGPFTLSLVR